MRELSKAEVLLNALTEALESAYISSWQSTSAWQSQLDDAIEYFKERVENNGN